MGIALLRLPGRRRSLEFGPDDLDRVAAALREAFGEPRVERHSALTVYRFPTATLIFQNEWGEPCLASRCAAGDRMLEHLARLLR